jgi:hypothetical protein
MENLSNFYKHLEKENLKYLDFPFFLNLILKIKLKNKF